MYENITKKSTNTSHAVMDSSFHSTPSKTRSGRIYASASKTSTVTSSSVASRSSVQEAGSSTEKIKPKPKLPTPDFEHRRELNLLQKDLNQFPSKLHDNPPPLNYAKRPVSRIRFQGSPASEPINSPSPPTNEVRAMRLFDDTNTSPVSVPKLSLKSKFFDQNRRTSAPAATLAFGDSEPRKRKRASNINPFTPVSIWASLRKKARMTSGESR